jgi:hypothetical protein
MRGQQWAKIVCGGQCGQAGEYVAEVIVWIMAVTLAAHDERVNDRSAIAGIGMADEEPVLRAEFTGADSVLQRVGIEFGVTVAEVRSQWGPVAEEVGAGLAEARLGQYARLPRRRQPAQPAERKGKVFLAKCRAFLTDADLVPLAFEGES